MKKIVLLAFALVVLSTAAVAKSVGPVKAGLPVHNIDTGLDYPTIQEAINANETLDGHTISVDVGIYYEHVVVNKSVSLIGENRSTTVIDGNMSGVSVSIWSSNVTVSGFTIRNGDWSGVAIYSNNCVISNNIITNNQIDGIIILGNDNLITNNIIANNSQGINISLIPGGNNTISDNLIASNFYVGVTIAYTSYDNKIFHNKFVNNPIQAGVAGGTNTWDAGYPSGGNYWSDYNGTDLYNGPYQNETGSDGIGDTPYVIVPNNQDNYPLMGMFHDFTVEIEGGQITHIEVISNSTVSDLEVALWLTSPNEYLQPGQPFISLGVSGEEGSLGFCRIMIPRVVLNDSYVVLVWWEYELGAWKLIEIPSTELPISNSIHAYIYFTYTHPLTFDNIIITIPEFPAWTSMLIILFVLTVATAIYKRRPHKTPTH